MIYVIIITILLLVLLSVENSKIMVVQYFAEMKVYTFDHLRDDSKTFNLHRVGFIVGEILRY